MQEIALHIREEATNELSSFVSFQNNHVSKFLLFLLL